MRCTDQQRKSTPLYNLSSGTSPYKIELPEDGRGPVQEIRGEVEHDGELGELLEQLPRGEGRVVRGPAADQEKPAAPLKKERAIETTGSQHQSHIRRSRHCTAD